MKRATSVVTVREPFLGRCARVDAQFSFSKRGTNWELGRPDTQPARKYSCDNDHSQPFFVAQQFTGFAGIYCKLADTLRSFDQICNGDCDDLPEQAFLYVGDIDSVREKAKKLAS